MKPTRNGRASSAAHPAKITRSVVPRSEVSGTKVKTMMKTGGAPRRSSPSHFRTSGKKLCCDRTNARVAAIVRAGNAAQLSLSIWREAAEETVVLPIWSRGEVDGVRIPSIAPVSDSERP